MTNDLRLMDKELEVHVHRHTLACCRTWGSRHPQWYPGINPAQALSLAPCADAMPSLHRAVHSRTAAAGGGKRAALAAALAVLTWTRTAGSAFPADPPRYSPISTW